VPNSEHVNFGAATMAIVLWRYYDYDESNWRQIDPEYLLTCAKVRDSR
jgi:preprotein translocase subunit Sec61beta